MKKISDQKSTCECGNETYSADGVCRACKFKKDFKEDINKPQENKMATNTECLTEGCARPIQKKGLCYKCYMKKYGERPYPQSKKSIKKKSPITSLKKQNTNGDIVDQLLRKYDVVIDEAKCLFVALRTIEKITGKHLNIPELTLTADI